MFLIEETHLKTLKHISQKLFTEDRLNGDQMRDFAQSINLILRFAESIGNIDDLIHLKESPLPSGVP